MTSMSDIALIRRGFHREAADQLAVALDVLTSTLVPSSSSAERRKIEKSLAEAHGSVADLHRVGDHPLWLTGVSDYRDCFDRSDDCARHTLWRASSRSVGVEEGGGPRPTSCYALLVAGIAVLVVRVALDNAPSHSAYPLGGKAAYHGYNLTYTGEITSISARFVTIYMDDRRKGKRLGADDFAFWNRRSLNVIEAENQSELRCI